MAVTNPSFETPGAVVGEALGWTTLDNSQRVEVAEFGPRLGHERFELEWVLPLGLFGSFPEHVWGSVTNNVFTPAAAPSSGFVGLVYAKLDSGIVPLGGLVVTMTYTNELLVAGRTATAVIPAGAGPGFTFSFDLDGADLGFTSIQNIQTTPAFAQTISAYGSHQFAPFNEESLFAFEDVNLDPAEWPIDESDDFEQGWDNDGGLLNDFGLLLQETASFDMVPQPVEDYENGWNLPQPVPIPLVQNETVLFGHEPFLDSASAAASFQIVAGVNDRVILRWTELGTFNDITAILAVGTYAAGATRIVAVAGSLLVDGETFIVDDGVNPPVTFEFDSNASVVETPTLRAVVFSAADDASQVRDAMETAVNNAPTLDIVATPGALGVLSLAHGSGGIVVVTETVANAGFLVTSSIAEEIQTKVRAALNAEPGPAVGTDFLTRVSPLGRVRLETAYDPGSGKPAMELVVAPTDSAWDTLGFAPSVRTRRSTQARNLTTALFDAGSQAFEDMEEGWRDNDLSIFSLPDDANGGIAAANFGGALPNTPEMFEAGWVLTL